MCRYPPDPPARSILASPKYRRIRHLILGGEGRDEASNPLRQRRKLPHRLLSNLRAFPITMMSENPMAAAQKTGLTNPSAASGTPRAL